MPSYAQRGARVLAASVVVSVGAWLASEAARADPAGGAWQVRRSATDPRLVERYRQALRRDPHDGPALRELVALYRRSRGSGAVLAFEQELATSAERTASRADWVVAARLALLRGDEAAAARHLLRAVALDPADLRAQLLLAGIERRGGQREEARRRYADVVERLSRAAHAADSRAPLRALADMALEDGDEASARKALEQLLALAPTDDASRRQLAELLARGGHATEALVEWRTLAKTARGPRDEQAHAWQQVARLAEDTGDVDGAHEALLRAVGLTPPVGRASGAAEHLAFHRRHDSLRALLDEEHAPRRAADWQRIARLRDEMGEPEEAIAACRRALAVEGRSLEPRRYLIALLERAGRDDEALFERRRLAAAAPTDPRPTLELAERLASRGADGKKESLSLLRRLGATRPGDAALHRQLAERYERLGDAAAALRERELMVRIDPDAAEAWIDLGEEELRRGDARGALLAWRRLLAPGDGKPGKAAGLDRLARMARLADVLIDHADVATDEDQAAAREVRGDAVLPAAAAADAAEQGVALYRQVLALAPHDLALGRAAALAFERTGYLDDAQAEWSRLVDAADGARARPLRLEAGRRLRLLLARRGAPDEQLASLRARFEGPPQRPFWGLILAESEHELERSEDAERTLERVLKAASAGPDRLDALLALSRLQRARHDLPRSIATLREAAALDAAHAPQLLGEVVDVALRSGRDDEAAAAARDAVTLAPREAAGHLRVAEVEERRGNEDLAITACGRALAIDAGNWRAHRAVARLLLRRGDAKAAGEHDRAVALLAPDEEPALEAARRAIDLAAYAGTLGSLEAAFSDAATAPGHASRERARFRRMLIEVIEARGRLGSDSSTLTVSSTRLPGPTVATPSASFALGQRALRPLTEALVDGDASEVAAAARVLASLGNPSAALPLLKLARRGEGAAAAVDSATPAAPPTRTTSGSTSPAIEVRASAAEGGARLAESSSQDDLLALSASPERALATAAIEGLARIGGAVAEAALERAGTDPTMRGAVCLARARSVFSDGDERYSAAKVSAANASTANVSTANASTASASTVNVSTAKAATANASTANASTASVSTANASTANASTVNVSTAKAASANISAATAAQRRATSPSVDMIDPAPTRAACALALASSADPRTVDDALRVLETDPDASVRAAAATALGRVQDPRASAPLLCAFFTDEDRVRRAAAAALCERARYRPQDNSHQTSRVERDLPFPTDAAALASWLASATPRCRAPLPIDADALAAALRSGLSADSARVLRTLADLDDLHREPGVALVAGADVSAGSLLRSSGVVDAAARAVEPLLLALVRGEAAGRDGRIRARAVGVLAQEHFRSGAIAVVAAMRDTSAAVRRAAAFALAGTTNPAQRRALELLRSDPAPTVRWAAARSLARRGSP